MNSDRYPRIAKYSLLVLFSSFSISAALSFWGKEINLSPEIHSTISLLMASLLFPSLAAIKYMWDPVHHVANEIKFVDSLQIKETIKGLMTNIEPNTRVGYFESNEVNALAISSISGRSSLIAFSSELLNQSDQYQFIAIAAHEVAHLINRDSVNKAYILSFNEAVKCYPMLFALMSEALVKPLKAMLLMIAALLLPLVAMSGGLAAAANFGYQWILLALQFLGVPAAAILIFRLLDRWLHSQFCAYSREREFAADAEGAIMTSKQDMKSALALLTDPDNKIGIFDTHPTLEERIARLS